MEIKGLYTALITPFNDDCSLDIEGLKNNIDFQINSGVDGVLVLGSTGEAATLTNDERTDAIKATIDVVNKRVPVMVGAGCNSTSVAIENSKAAKELGADSILQVVPYYNKPTQAGIFQHFSAIASAVDIPIMVYDVPGRTVVSITTDTLSKLVDQHPNIVSLKDASGDVCKTAEVIKSIQNKNSNFMHLSGDDGLFLPMASVGSRGLVSVISNLMPKECSEMVNAATSGDYQTARDLHFKLMPLMSAAFVESNPIPMKKAMDMVGMSGGPCRLPLSKPADKTVEILEQTISELGIK